MRKEIKSKTVPSSKTLLTYWLRKLEKYSAIINATFEEYREAHQIVRNLVVEIIQKDQNTIKELKEQIEKMKKKD